MMDTSAPITVVGAGPSGLASAIVLARAGKKVVVRESHKSVGARFHGDFQGLENWSVKTDVLDELRDLGITADFPVHPILSGAAYDADGRKYEVRDEKPLYYLVRRGPGADTLDSALLQAADKAGADIRFGDKVERVPPDAIVATGPRRADAIASGYIFTTDMADASHVSFDDRLAPWGYAYLLIANGIGTVAVCMFRDFKNHAVHLKEAVAYFERLTGVEMTDPKPFGGFGMLSHMTRVERGGRLLVGERAGLQDALAGFGMRYALISGALAARAKISGQSYASLLNRRMRSIHRAGIVNRFVFQTLGNKRHGWALSKLSAGAARRGLRRLYGGSLLHSILYPGVAWRYAARLNHPGCDHIDCDCPWCRMQGVH
ncbi:MAG: NAD(P)/FAD-dependent oxidoreductase [Alphaproteobacteria bacterium]|nr:NAD(P)/FAD-dependent oxidoreductase [Alphaproteobacteria bacterium]